MSQVTSIAPTHGQPTVDDLGGFWIRVASYLIDACVTTLVGAVIGGVLGFSAALMHYEVQDISWVIKAMTFSLSIVYFTAFQALFEGSLGKHAMGLRLVNEDFESMTIKQSFKRYFALGLGSIVLGLTYFSIGWHPRKQGWHDRFAKTLVVRKTFLDRIHGGGQGHDAQGNVSPISRAA
jgi:uncharacterized RDD family membrane protein YckC